MKKLFLILMLFGFLKAGAQTGVNHYYSGGMSANVSMHCATTATTTVSGGGMYSTGMIVNQGGGCTTACHRGIHRGCSRAVVYTGTVRPACRPGHGYHRGGRNCRTTTVVYAAPRYRTHCASPAIVRGGCYR